MKSYIKGRRLEYKVKKLLEDKGYYVIRSAGSHGSADLIAGNGYEVMLIQCKTDIKKISKEDIRELNRAAVKVKAKPFIVGDDMNFINVKM